MSLHETAERRSGNYSHKFLRAILQRRKPHQPIYNLGSGAKALKDH